MRYIQHNKPYLDEREITAYKRVLDHEWLLSGKEVADFEEKIKKISQRKYAIAVNSGSAAIHVSLLALNVQKDDEVIVPSYTDSALLNTIYYLHAHPVVVDTEQYGFNADPLQIEQKLTKKTKAIILPHMFGYPASIEQIQSYGVPIIEDVAQAIGSTYNGRPLGSFGNVSIFSFYATKLIATGQGGMVVTDSKELYDFITDIIDYDQRENYIVRYNYMMTDTVASMGNTQIEKLNEILTKRKEIGNKYREVLVKKQLSHFPKRDEMHVNHYRFLLQFPDESARNTIQKKFAENNIETIVPFKNFQMLHNFLHLRKQYFPYAEMLTKTLLSVPIYTALTESDIAHIIAVMEKIL